MVAAIFTGTHKTLAFGLPLLNTVFQGHPALGIITAPLLVYHPMQMVAGALMTSSMREMVERGTSSSQKLATS